MVKIVRRVVVGGVAAIALIVVVAVLAFAIGYVRADVPQPGELRTNQVATIFDKDGKTVLARVVPPEGNRSDIAADQIPESMEDAVMAAEDRSFKTNPGFSVSGFARAVLGRLPGFGGSDDAGGGSTITQQYVKNALVGDEHSLTRKWRELIISTKMSRSWSKDEIMAAYLNTIYFGRDSYGLQAAARAYFNEPASKLTVAQSALLAAVVRSPSYYDPAVTPQAAIDRWNWVLDGMVSMGTLQKTDRDAEKFPKTVAPGAGRQTDDLSNGPNGLIKTQVLQELKDAGISEQDLNTQGLQITTTIDPQAQAAAVKAAHSTLTGEPKKLRTAVVSVDPKTGGISAYYGGDDGNGYDRVQAGLQTGSSFKVFALLAALEQGIPLSRVYSSAPLDAAGVHITNSDGESCGSCNLATALKMSLNTVYYRLMLDLKGQAQTVADTAHKAGVAESFGDIAHTLQQPNGVVQGGVVLGQYLTRPIDMASAYATIAASGVYRKPHLIQKVVTADGRVLLDRGADPGQREFSADVANNTIAAMEPIAAYSNGHSLADGRLSASKTGTAQYKDTGQNKDAWMVGFTPSLSTAVWVGADDGSPITNSSGGIIYGSQLPSDIWQATMDGALDGTDDESFPTPGEIGGQAGVPVETTYAPSTSRDRSFGRYPTGDASSDGGYGSAPRTIPGLPGVPMPTFPGFGGPTGAYGAGDGTGDGGYTTVPRRRGGAGSTGGYGAGGYGGGGGTGANGGYGGTYTRVAPTPP
ncbi:transglycosylase domain-containing protein [Tsukamurella soli]|uniref:transglycosylase domain-containing protein n=1 Tax=Tsukamurella soli TaxID=644556 RepID=UPI0031EE998B